LLAAISALDGAGDEVLDGVTASSSVYCTGGDFMK
jgi:hypothetical protein